MSSTKTKDRAKSILNNPSKPTVVDGASLEPFLQMLSAAGTDQSLVISAEMVRKVNTGARGEILAFLAEHMRGREEVKKARQVIAEAGAAVNPHVLEVEKLERRVKSARMAVEIARREREEKRARQQALEQEQNGLEKSLRRERELERLLGALESREGVRVERIAEVKKMLDQLRRQVEGTKKGDSHGPPCPQVIPFELKPPKWRPRHTKETIAKLHACHIRLNSLTGAQICATKAAEERLKNTVRSSIRKGVTEDEWQEILNACKIVAEERIGRMRIGHTTVHHIVDWEELERKARETRTKEAKVTSLNEAFIAKMSLVENYLRVVDDFRGRNMDTIRTTLKEEEEESRGYVENVKSALIKSCVTKTEKTVVRNRSEQLGRELRRCYEMEEFLKRLSTLKSTERAGRDAEIIAAYRRGVEETGERIERLLKRKIGKGGLGLEVAEEVKVLCAEAQALSG